MEKTSRKKTLIGEVTSDKMDKTIVVKVGRLLKHPMFNKMIRRAKKYKAHDRNNDCKIGDEVQIIESRPLSKDKKWRLLKVISRGKS